MAALIVAALGACAHARRAAAAPGGPIEATAWEASYRWLFANNGSYQKQTAEVYCIGVGSLEHYTDPDPRVVRRFTHDSQSVVPVSHCTDKGFTTACEQGRKARPLGQLVSVREEPSCRFGIIFLLTTAERDSVGLRFEATVYEGPLAGEGRTLVVIRERSGWRIEPSFLKWQS